MSPPLRAPLPALRRSWRPSPLIRGSVAMHVGAAVAVLVRPPAWPWALSAVLANHLLLTAAGLWPRSRWLGPNWTHLPPAAASGGCSVPEAPGAAAAVALTLDDGPDPDVTGRVLDLLDAHGASATFFCIGDRVARHPGLARAIVARGHEIGNHSYRHLKRFSLLGPRGLGAEIRRAQQAILDATGEVPRFFRAPAGLRNPFLEPVLAQEGLQLVSWTRRGFDTVNGSPGAVLGRLTRRLQAGDILLLHDGHAARTAAGAPVILEVLPRLLAVLATAHLTPITLAAALARAAAPLT
ncbi:MAG TPA: polysaccharide deacetylase family protein [Steroidobacteraceae bacterium]|nr:polysaccharide deacetylase family protein [Steroidobacteraceae bacterium]